MDIEVETKVAAIAGVWLLWGRLRSSEPVKKQGIRYSGEHLTTGASRVQCVEAGEWREYRSMKDGYRLASTSR